MGIGSTYNVKAPHDVTLKTELSKKTVLNKMHLIVDREAVTYDLNSFICFILTT